jgi:hypothetical protein
MNRRSFLGLTFGGVAATAAVRTWPFRVFSFPTEPILRATSVRFVRMYDPIQMKMINRFDVLYGFGKLHAPGGLESVKIINASDCLDQETLDGFKVQCARDYGQAIECLPVMDRMPIPADGSKQIHCGWDIQT